MLLEEALRREVRALFRSSDAQNEQDPRWEVHVPSGFV